MLNTQYPLSTFDPRVYQPTCSLVLFLVFLKFRTARIGLWRFKMVQVQLTMPYSRISVTDGICSIKVTDRQARAAEG